MGPISYFYQKCSRYVLISFVSLIKNQVFNRFIAIENTGFVNWKSCVIEFFGNQIKRDSVILFSVFILLSTDNDQVIQVH